MMLRLKFLLTIFALFCSALLINAETKLELASPFVDNMVLQRQMDVPVWGWAPEGSEITVSFAGQTVTSKTDKLGKWMVKLKPLNASADERALTVTAANEEIVRKGVLVGEVWLVSGQSNMDWIAGKSNCRNLASMISKEKPPIREYLVDTGSAVFPRSRTVSTTGWKKPGDASDFSAIALSFSWSLYQELKVPIGLLRSTHGATQIGTWTAYEGFADHPKLQDIAAKIRSSNPAAAEGKKAFEKYFSDLQKWQKDSEETMNRGGTALKRPPLPGICDEWRGPTRMYNMKIHPLVPYALRGAIWNQGEHNSGDGKIYAAKMEALINGWRKVWNKPEMSFYFTQMQCYGDPDPDSLGFADIREAQTLFFLNNKNVGMAPQYDFNPGNPRGIHNYNKLHAGSRMGRWALAKDYGKDIAYTGPIYKSHKVEGSKVHIEFEQRGPGGGLMVGSKGMEKDKENYVEPAVKVDEELKHFRLAGKDKVWHEANAVIEGNKVVVSSEKVPNPVGVQYAYFNSPVGANLYNEAGLPAIPFARFNGKQMFKEDDPVIVAAEKAEAERKWGKKVYLHLSSLFRDGLVIQREKALPVWGHGIPGSTVTLSFAGQTRTAKVDEFERWSLELDPLQASSEGREMIVSSSAGEKKIVKDIVVGDVWFISGDRNQTNPMRSKDEIKLKSLPNIREFRQRTNARRFKSPRKKRMEVGSGKYESSWQIVDFDDKAHYPTELAYHFAKGFDKNVPVGIINVGAPNPPLSWISYKALQTAAGFEAERDEINLEFPNTDVCKKAVKNYIRTLKAYSNRLALYMETGREIPDGLALNAPAFPQPKQNQWAKRVETPTKTYNFCISPLSPFAIKGFVWIPGKDNISTDVSKYAPSLKVFIESMAETFGQRKVDLFYVQPEESLVEGVKDPEVKGAKKVIIKDWPKSLKEIAEKLGKMAY